MLNLVWLIPILPLIGFVINGLGYKTLPKNIVALIGSSVIVGAFFISFTLFWGLVNHSIPVTTIQLFNFIHAGNFSIDFAFYIDELSAMMLLIITGVGFLIHIYSVGYMHDDEGFNKFFAYLNLFVFFMLLLVLGANYATLFIGWEGVGLSSYLLIGFWFKNNAYNDAAKKAFIMNRIGDMGFLLGMFLLIQQFGTLDFVQIFEDCKAFEVDTTGVTILTAITISLFIGATGKSAQIPLFTWLPDAMAGPTPVSALIHAATMVTAGIYMIARSNALYALTPITMAIIAGVGIATALLAALIGFLQNDIKKVLAYSTVSQLGYMFVGLGVGTFTGAFFHVFTHAFFKALLFLGAGSVIHGMSGDQDIRNMGGLYKKMPITFFTFLIGTIAIAGIPPLSGFFSKDMILAKAFEYSPILWALGVLGSACTAFYMFRVLLLTFFGKFRGTEVQAHHLHESPLSMVLPLVILALFSAFAGFFNVPEIFGGAAWISSFLSPVFEPSASILEASGHVLDHALEYMLMSVSVGVAIVSIVLAIVFYVVLRWVPMPDGSTRNMFSNMIYNKFYIDELYDLAVRKPIDALSSFTYTFIELMGIDKLVNGIGGLTQMLSKSTTKMQTGYVGAYIFLMVLGIGALLASLLFW